VRKLRPPRRRKSISRRSRSSRNGCEGSPRMTDSQVKPRTRQSTNANRFGQSLRAKIPKNQAGQHLHAIRRNRRLEQWV
jgi:hypothetical protein